LWAPYDDDLVRQSNDAVVFCWSRRNHDSKCRSNRQITKRTDIIGVLLYSEQLPLMTISK